MPEPGFLSRLKSMRYYLLGGGTLTSMAMFGLYAFQEKLIYLPTISGPKSPKDNPKYFKSPDEINLVYENVEIETEDHVKLRGWFIMGGNIQNYDRFPTVIFFHENAGNIGFRLQYIKQYIQRVGVNFLIIAYRGYSDSEGSPSQQGIQKDAKAILDYAKDRFPRSKLIVHGRSLGGGVAAYVLANHDHRVSKVILENTFTSIRDVITTNYSIFLKGCQFLLRNKWESINYIQKISIPKLFIRTTNDQVVPDKLMQKLYDAADDNKSQLVFTKGGHNGNWFENIKDYFDGLDLFINSD